MNTETLNNCPKCGKNSYIKVPMGCIMRESMGMMIHIADEHKYECLNDSCGYKTDIVRINNKFGDYYELPFWKRIFKII